MLLFVSIVALFFKPSKFNIESLEIKPKDNLLVFIALVDLLSITERLESFFGFMATIFIGSKIDIANVTTFVANNFFF